MRLITLAVAVVVGLLGLSPIESAQATSAAAGFSAPTQRLIPGCTWYTYSYWVQPDGQDWLIQIRIKDAAGTAQAFQFFNSGSPGDPTTGSSRFQLCSANVHAPGTFTITGELDLSDGARTTVLTLPTFHFQITPPASPTKAALRKAAKKKARAACRKFSRHARRARCVSRKTRYYLAHH